MSFTLDLKHLLLLAGFILFVLGFLNWPKQVRFNLTSGGLACWILIPLLNLGG